VTSEEKLRYVFLIFLAAAVVSLLMTIIAPRMMREIAHGTHFAVISFPIAFGSLSTAFLIAWGYLYLPEPLRFIVTGRQELLGIGIFAAAGQTLAQSSFSRATLEVSPTNAVLQAEANPLPKSGGFDAWPTTVSLLVVLVLAVFLTWL
jgi:hypothetical protein